MSNTSNAHEWRRFFAALGVVVVILVVLVVAFMAGFGRGDDSSTTTYSTSSTPTPAYFLQGERQYLKELYIAGIYEPGITADEVLDMGYNVCEMLETSQYDTPMELADYLYEFQGIEQLDVQSTYEDIFAVVTFSDLWLCGR